MVMSLIVLVIETAVKMAAHGHTMEHRGARVLVTMTDGTQFRDVFIERARSRRWIVLKQRGKVSMRSVATLSKIGKRDFPIQEESNVSG